MLAFVILVLILDILSKIPCGYKDVPMSNIEARGYDPTNIDDVMEYYEQKQSGYFKLDDE